MRKKRKEDTPPATRGHRTARLVKEREREKERKKERRSHRARGGGGAGAGRGVAFQKRIKDRDGVLNGLILTIQTTMLFFFRRQGRLGIFLSLLLFFSTKIEHSCALESPIEQLPTFKPQCFDEVYTGRPNFSPSLEKFLSFRNTIKLEVAWWETSYMLTHAFSILLTEKLGYRTEINDFTKMNYTQFAMENGITNAFVCERVDVKYDARIHESLFWHDFDEP